MHRIPAMCTTVLLRIALIAAAATFVVAPASGDPVSKATRVTTTVHGSAFSSSLVLSQDNASPTKGTAKLCGTFAGSKRHGIRMRVQLEQLKDGVWTLVGPADTKAVSVVVPAGGRVKRCTTLALALDEDVVLTQSGPLRTNGFTLEPATHRSVGNLSLGFIPPQLQPGAKPAR